MKLLIKTTFAFLFTTMAMHTFAQTQLSWDDIDTTGFYKKEIFKKNGITLTVINKDSLFNPNTLQKLTDVFWKIYPEEMKRFNRKASKNVTILISHDYKGVAATYKSYVKIDQDWLTAYPEDVDVITHEAMHIVQAYDFKPEYSWLTEGIADYARYKYGVYNKESGWSLTSYKPGQSYRNSYRISARFLVWLEKTSEPIL